MAAGGYMKHVSRIMFSLVNGNSIRAGGFNLEQALLVPPTHEEMLVEDELAEVKFLSTATLAGLRLRRMLYFGGWPWRVHLHTILVSLFQLIVPSMRHM